jgi:ComF family protein
MNLLHRILDGINPPLCGGCGAPLYEGEECLCHRCLNNLPRTNLHLVTDNWIAQRFWGIIPIERATAMLRFTKESITQNFIHALKYRNCPEYGFMIGRMMAEEIAPSGFFDDVDCIIPIPLHPNREHQRGYNQSERIASGVADVTGIEVLTDAVARIRDTATQTMMSEQERVKNVAGAFRLSGKVDLEGRHVLLVDDVLTTGSTATACAEAFLEVNDIRFSILALAVAQ